MRDRQWLVFVLAPAELGFIGETHSSCIPNAVRGECLVCVVKLKDHSHAW
jgi:hypothetical protein